MPKIQVYGKIFKGEKIILNIIIFREKLKKMLYSLVEYGQKAVQITRQANNLDGFLSIWSASRPIFDRKSLNCYSKSKFRAISYLSNLPSPPLPNFPELHIAIYTIENGPKHVHVCMHSNILLLVRYTGTRNSMKSINIQLGLKTITLF